MPVSSASTEVPTESVSVPLPRTSMPPSEMSPVCPRYSRPPWRSTAATSQGRRSWRRRSPISLWRRKVTKRVCSLAARLAASSPERSIAAPLSCARADARPISAAVLVTDATKREASAALRDNSPVVAPCSSIALAIAENTGRIAAIAAMMRFTAAINSCASRCNWSILRPISSVAFCVAPESDLTSCATTAKPRPASPARTASIVALSASRLVCLAIAAMRLTTLPIWADEAFSPSTLLPAAAAASPASSVSVPASRTWRPISSDDFANSSVASARWCAFSVDCPASAASCSLCAWIVPSISAVARVPPRTASEARCTSRIIAARSTSIRSMVSRTAASRACD